MKKPRIVDNFNKMYFFYIGKGWVIHKTEYSIKCFMILSKLLTS